MHDKIITKYAKHIEPVGSRITCSPPPTDTDEDYLVLCNNDTDFWELAELLQVHKDYELCGLEDYLIPADEEMQDWGSFQSYRKGDLNYILTYRKDFFDNFMAATAVAKAANLLKKEQRVALFQWVLYDHFEDELDKRLDEIGITEIPTTEQVVEALHTINWEA